MIDVIGLFFLAVLVGLSSIFVPDAMLPKILWIFVYALLSVASLFAWHHPKAPKKPISWFYFALFTVIGAPAWFGLATLGSAIFFPGTEPALSKIVDLLVTVLICPVGTIVALLGSVRCVIVARCYDK